MADASKSATIVSLDGLFVFRRHVHGRATFGVEKHHRKMNLLDRKPVFD